ncbi:MAG: glycosyltransferase family 2 protein [Bacteroidia bacterium]|nr:glycosyltransferase family 2 protein [Bacteroidia bacterium]
MASVSAVIITLNEAANIGRCLASLKGVADEIIVADSGSTDDTEAICRASNVRFFRVEWLGYSQTKNWANDLATGDYILSLDADEVLSEPLRQAILPEKKHLSGAYSFNRLTNYCGHWVRYCGWYPDRKVRLFPKNQARWEGEFVHEILQTDSSLNIRHLSGDILHYSYNSLADFKHRMDRYSTLAAEDLHNRGKKASWWKLVFSPLLKFIILYFVRRGFLDGKAGGEICYFSAQANYLRYKKLQKLNAADALR